MLEAVGFLLTSLLYTLFSIPFRYFAGNTAFVFLDAVLP